MNSETKQHPPHCDARPGGERLYLGWWLVMAVLLLHIYARHVPWPWVVFVAADWANYPQTLWYDSFWDAVRTGLQNPNRPISTVAVETVFPLFGRNPLPWTLLSITANALLLMAVMKMALELSASRRMAALSGIVLAVLPNLTETYLWSTQILNEVSCALVFYALSAWMWIAYMRLGGAWRLVVSAFAYLIGLFSYEAGILLPAAYMVLIPWRQKPFGGMLRLMPFAAICLLYMAWRVTDAFGTNQSWYYPPHMEAGISLWGVGWNIRQMIHWWAGDHMFGSMLSGFQSFAMLAPWTRRFLVLGNILVVGLIGCILRRLGSGSARKPLLEGHAAACPWARKSVPLHEGTTTQECETGIETQTFSLLQIVSFGVVWTGAAMAIPILSYTESRLMVLPAIGISLLTAIAFSRLSIRYWGALLFVPMVLALTANQGTTESYRQVSVFNDRLYTHLEQTKEEWRDKEAVLFDTRAMRNRLTPGLLRPVGEDEATWARYNNALLFRGFLPAGMIRLITGEYRTPVRIVHDVEHGARIEGDTLYWHARYNPAWPYETPMDRVFVVDVHEVAVSGKR